MKFDEMSVEQLEARQAELIEAETEGVETEEIESRANEFEAIKAELEARKAAAEAAEEARKAVENGAGETREEHKEEKKMEVSEIRNSPEYLDAFANYIRTGNDSECRTVLLSKNAPASGQLPVPDMLEGVIKTAWESNEFLNQIKKRNTSCSVIFGNLNYQTKI